MNNEARVSILSNVPKTKSGTFKNDRGEDVEYTTVTQKARLEVNGFAYPYDVRLEEDQSAWQVGDYLLDLAAMVEVKNNKIGLSKFASLVPIKQPAKV